MQVINRIGRAGEKYPKSRQDWEVLEKYARSTKYPQAKELALFFLEMSGRRAPNRTGKDEKADAYEKPLLEELDGEVRLDIAAEIYEQIINYMYQREEFPDQRQKRETLDKICKVLFAGHQEVLTRNNDELGMLYDRTMMEVIEDIENDEF